MISHPQFFLLPLREKVPEGRMRGLRSSSPRGAYGSKPLTRLGLRPIHPLPQGERGKAEMAG